MEDIIDLIGLSDMKDYRKVWRQLLAEFIGSFLYLAIELLVNTKLGTTTDITRIALSSGLIVASIVQVIGHVSGGHINPAITLGALIFGHIKLIRAVCFIIVQILGATAGATVAYLIATEKTREELGATYPMEAGTEKAFAVEFLTTFLIVSVFLSVSDSGKSVAGLGSAALAVGLAITGCQCACLRYSGSMNPIRSVGPAVVMRIWTDHWIYWFGPMSGGILAGLVYKYVFTLNNTSFTIE